MVRENRLFVGNPGTGKSTLINCLMGEAKLPSGLSFGGGLTKGYRRFEHDGVAYMDTPGLADETIADEAAKAITKALKQGGAYKLFFMVRLQNGRVVGEDVVTLERVLDSIKDVDVNNKYTIVMNGVGPQQYQTLIQRGDAFNEVKRVVNQRLRTDSFCFVPRMAELEERTNHVVSLPHEFCSYVEHNAPVIQIHERQVRLIDVSDLLDHIGRMKRELEKLYAELERRHGASNSQPSNPYYAIPVSPGPSIQVMPPPEATMTFCNRKQALSLGTTAIILMIAGAIFFWRLNESN